MMTQKTPLYDWHKSHGAKMVEFAGFLMPVFYQGVLAEHQAVREACGLFDISHMGEIFFEGPQAIHLLQQLTTNDVSRLKDGEAQYSLLLNDQGFPLDDILVYRLGPEKFFLCVNASNVQKDFNWIESQNYLEVAISNRSAEIGMIALQGPRSFEVLRKLGFDLNSIPRFSCTKIELQKIPVILSRTGYTGEEGCELFVENEHLVKMWSLLFESGQEFGLLPVGLGARDTLRLEMGYALYGHELSESINPLEANLSWVIQGNKNFTGREALLKIKSQGIQRRLIGLILEEPGIPREGMDLYFGDQKIGQVLSGTMSPSLKQGIATGLVHCPFDSEKDFWVDIRGKLKKAKKVKLPFLKLA